MAQVRSKNFGLVKFSIPSGPIYIQIKKLISENKLTTVCTEAKCPNIGECFSRGRATFLILGSICTRNCLYCSIDHGQPKDLDLAEPHKVATAISDLKIKHAVITSVTRDDLFDGGANHFAKTITLIKEYNPLCRVEVLIPDFGDRMSENLGIIIKAKPDIINHNIETVKSLFTKLRPAGNYQLSLDLIKMIRDFNLVAKSGLMIGFGEKKSEIKETLKDLIQAGCQILTIGQYLQSAKKNYPVKKYYSLEEFAYLKEMAEDLGFEKVSAAPKVRSSYQAEDVFC